MIIKRTIHDSILKSLSNADKNTIIIYGPRQAGKTTLVQQIAIESKLDYLLFTGDDIRTQELFSKPSLDNLQLSIGHHSLVIIDEAQRIENIGLSLKLIHDNLPTRCIATGSSSFDLANRTNEPLTGRTHTFTLYPLGLEELPIDPLDPQNNGKIKELLRFGLYPRAYNAQTTDDKSRYLTELLNNYLYKDILMFDQIRKPKKMIDLLRLIALQIGNEVKISELSAQLGLSKLYIEKYLDILEKMFVLVNIRGFSRNLRKEINKTSKYYFYDIGLRNALLNDFKEIKLRNDTGVLFENLCVMERIKHHNNHNIPTNFYFWRTYDQKEIDLIEERNGNLYAYEIKFNAQKTISSTTKNEFLKAYPNTTFETVTPSNISLLTKF